MSKFRLPGWTSGPVSVITIAVLLGQSYAERFGVIRDSSPGTKTVEGFSHWYDSRLWLGQPQSQVCRNLNYARDLLLISSGSCLTPRLASVIQRPILMVQEDVTVAGCLNLDHANYSEYENSTLTNSSTNSHVIPLYLNSYQLTELIYGLVKQAFQFENVILVHVCDHSSYCGRNSMEEVVARLHESLYTSIQCWMTVKNETEFEKQFDGCMGSVTFLSLVDRWLLIVLHTGISVISSSLKTLNTYAMMSVETKVVFVVPPNYPVSDLDFVHMKDRDDLSVIRWAGETWLASITQRTAERYSSFWGPNVHLNSIIPNLEGILTIASASPSMSRMIASADPYQVMQPDICAASAENARQLIVISNDLLKVLSCVENVGWEVCSSYAVIKYVIDPRNDVPRAETPLSWSTRTGYRGFQFIDHDVNLRGRKLRVAVMPSPPFLRRNATAYEAFDGNDTTGLYEGVIPNMLKTLSRVMNFRYELILPQPGEEYYGKRNSAGHWNGLMGMLQRGEVDMIASDVCISKERQDDVDFTVPFYEDSLTVLLPRSQFDRSPFTFLFPFSRTVWLCVLAAVGLSGPLLYFFSRSSPYYVATDQTNYFASLSESYMYCYGAIVSQGGTLTPEADSSRIFMVFWWLFGICTVATYSGNLIAFLTFPGKLTFVDSFDDFVYTSNIQPVIDRHSYTESVFTTANKRSYRDAWKKILQNPQAGMADYYQEAVDKVSRYKYGYIGSLAKMKATIADDSFDEGPCQYALLRKPLEKINYAFAFKKGTNYATLFSKWIRRMSYAGLIEHWMAEELDRNHRPKRCQDELEHPPDEVRKVGIGDVMGVYICLGCGSLLACLVFLMELMTTHTGRVGQRLRTYFDGRIRKRRQDRDEREKPTITLNNGKVLKSV